MSKGFFNSILQAPLAKNADLYTEMARRPALFSPDEYAALEKKASPEAAPVSAPNVDPEPKRQSQTAVSGDEVELLRTLHFQNERRERMYYGDETLRYNACQFPDSTGGPFSS